MSKEKKQTWLANGLILISVLGRLLPHPANVTPLGAVSLVGGAKLTKLWRWTVPFVALILSDILLSFFFNYHAFTLVTLFIYASFAINILLGRFIKGNKRYFKLGGLVLVGSLQFFIITNFGVWMEGLLYAKTFPGLVQCYTAALPYLRNSLLGDLCWSFVLFTLIDRSQVWLQNRSPQTASASA